MFSRLPRFEADARAKRTPPISPGSGLTSAEEALRKVLAKFGFDVLPDIEEDVLARTRKACNVTPDDRILGVVAMGDEDDEAILLVGCHAFYWRKKSDSPHPGVGALSHEQLATRRFVNHGHAVYLGNDQYVCPNEDTTGEELTGFSSGCKGVSHGSNRDTRGRVTSSSSESRSTGSLPRSVGVDNGGRLARMIEERGVAQFG